MKNLKKVLALVLVVATLMGLATVAGAAFTDAGSIDKTEAVDVLAGLGIIKGYTDGSFKPEGNVTRAEMAKMVTMLISGGEDVGELYTGANVFSDCTTHWAKGYIAYANTTGIVAGVGNGLFNPNGSVTGTQAAKMMLVALGYDAATEGYTGSGWSVNVLADARDAGLLKGIEDVNMASALSRENAAQLMLNTLTATMVEYQGGTNVTTSDGTTVIVNAIRVNKTNSASDDYVNSLLSSDPAYGDGLMQLCERYFGDLEKTTGTSDEFGRTASHSWKLDGDELHNATAKPVVTYTGKVSAADVAKDLNGYDIDKDGTAGGTTYASVNNTTEYGTSADAPNNSALTVTGIITANNGTGNLSVGANAANKQTIADAIASLTLNGKVVEIYADSSHHITKIVTITYTVGTVTDVNSTKTGTSYTVVSTDNSGTDTQSGTVYAEDQDREDTVVLAGAVKEDDVVTYVQPTGGSTLYIYPTTSFVGAQSNRNSDTITVNGTKYSIALGVNNDGTNAISQANFSNSTEDANYYVDQYGYVVYTDAVASTTNYAVVDKIALVGTTGTAGNKSVEAVLVFADGTSKTVNVTKINGFEAKNITEAAGSATVGFTTDGTSKLTKIALSTNVADNTKMTNVAVTYKEKSAGYEIDYVMTLAASKTNVGNEDSTTGGLFASNYKGLDDTTNAIVKGVPSIYDGTGTTSSDVVTTGNNNTVYVIKTDDGKFVSYTGFANVPTVLAAATGNSIAYVNEGTIAEFVYIDAEGGSVGDTKSGDMFYVTNVDWTENLNGEDTLFTLTGILNGEEGVITTEDYATLVGGTSAMVEDSLYELDVDDNGYVTAAVAQAASSTTYKATAVAAAEAKDGILATDAGAYTYNSDTVVIVIEGDEVTGSSIASAKEDDAVYIKVVDAAGTDAEKIAIDTIYIVKA